MNQPAAESFTRDVTPKTDAERGRVVELLQQAPAAIAVFRGPDHVYEVANPRYLALVGRTGGLVGKSIRAVFPEAEGQGVFEACDRVYQTGEPFVVHEMPVSFDRGRGKEEGWFAFTITAVREGAQVTGLMCVAIDVTDQVRARQQVEAMAKALATSERRFRSLVEASSEMVWSTNARGEVQADSPSWRGFTGQTYDAWKGYGWLDAVHPEDRARAEKAWLEAVAAKSKYEVDYRVRRADGSYAHTLARGTPILGEDGEITEWIGLNFDITPRVQAEQALLENDRRLRLALSAGRLGTWEYDFVENRVHWSPEIEGMHGIPVGSFDGTFEAYQSDIHPDDRAWVLDAIQRNVAEGREHKLVYRIIRPDGAVRWLEAAGMFVRDATGRPVRLTGVCADVTDRIEADAAKNALRVQTMLEGIGDSFAVYDRQWTVLYANRTARGDRTPAEMIGKNIWKVVPEAVGTRFHTELLKVLETGQPVTFEEYFAPTATWHEVHAYAVDEIGVAVYARDITGRREEQSLRDRLVRYGELRAEVGSALAMHASLRDMLQACCTAIVEKLRMSFARIWLTDRAQEFLDLQASAGKYTHIDGGHGHIRIGDFKIGKIASERQPHMTNDVQHDPRVGNQEWARREGMVAFAGYPLIVDDRLVGVMAAFSTEPLPDDTLAALGSIGDAIAQGVERRRAEIRLEEHARDLARSNADLEQFAYVASHDLQEPLRMVASYNQLLARRYRGKLDKDADDFIGFTVEGVARMQTLINDLLAYSRVGRRAKDLAPVDLGKVLAATLSNLERSIAEQGAIVTADPMPEVMGDQVQLTQLLQNLVANGIKFHGEEAPRIHVGARREGDEWVLSVRDNGIGVEEQYFDRIFVIFQRLHSRDKYAGTGIGLAICKKIVERHGGRIWLESEPGKGTTMFFTLREVRLNPNKRNA